MPAIDGPNIAIASGNCGNPRRRAAGRAAGKGARTSEAAAAENALIEKSGRFRWDPLGYIAFAFPWGKPGTALSPDDGDALALTFAYPLAKRDWAEERRFEEKLGRLRR